MAQHGDAIARYHKFLEQDSYRDLAWADELQERMRQQQLTDAGRLLAPVLRPQFISARQLESLCRVAEHLASILDQLEALVLECPVLLSRLQMLPAEKMLASVPRCYSRLSVTSRMDANAPGRSSAFHLQAFHFSLVALSTFTRLESSWSPPCFSSHFGPGPRM